MTWWRAVETADDLDETGDDRASLDHRNRLSVAAMPAAPTPAQQLIGDFAPKLVELTDEVLFDDVWSRPGLSPRDRSLITVAALTSLYRTDQLTSHLRRALANGVTVEELTETITHLAFYAGWPCAMTAITTLKDIVESAGN